MYTFGDGSNGQLGHGTTILIADTPQELSWGKNVRVSYASCGENSTALVTGLCIIAENITRYIALVIGSFISITPPDIIKHCIVFNLLSY